MSRSTRAMRGSPVRGRIKAPVGGVPVELEAGGERRDPDLANRRVGRDDEPGSRFFEENVEDSALFLDLEVRLLVFLAQKSGAASARRAPLLPRAETPVHPAWPQCSKFVVSGQPVFCSVRTSGLLLVNLVLIPFFFAFLPKSCTGFTCQPSCCLQAAIQIVTPGAGGWPDACMRGFG